MPDPLVAAMFDKLPRPGQPFPAEQRAAWLKMMALTFDIAYGTVAEELPAFIGKVMVAAEPAKAEPPALKPVKPGPRFVIDRDGFARRGTGEPVMPGDVTDIIVDLRGEFGDLGAIIWADGSTGVKGHQLDISSTAP